METKTQYFYVPNISEFVYALVSRVSPEIFDKLPLEPEDYQALISLETEGETITLREISKATGNWEAGGEVTLILSADSSEIEAVEVFAAALTALTIQGQGGG